MFYRGDKVIYKPANSGLFIGIILAVYRDLDGIEECICQVISREPLKFIAPASQLKVYIEPKVLEMTYERKEIKYISDF